MIRTDLSRRKFLRNAVLAAGSAAATVGGYTLFEPHNEVVENIDLRLARLPEAFNGFKLVQISDLHFGDWLGEDYFAAAMERINGLSPDAVVVTGDFITAHERRAEGDRADLEACAKVLGKLRAPHGIFGAIGNHDHRADADMVADTLAPAGTRVLRNEAVPIEKDGQRLWICGLDDPLYGVADVAETLARAPESECKIALAHEPDFADELARHPVDLQLSGHTHGGQVRLPVLTRFALPPMGEKYISGHFRIRNMQLYVNRGLGVIGLPFRLACRPEITLMTLRRG